ncbi:MAG: Stp1/IreP family PP2C-type Ser/Thr phosphatase, partial [Clostridia bacterium]|nr:Stp1/IreP family PP2C-type Ser/Thr phosphatase [Clostridia bacterium]
MRLFSKVDIGKVRTSNQDAAEAFMITDNVAFAVCCDGMGGAKGGDIASSNAIQVISDYIKNSYIPGMSNEKVASLLKNAIVSANYTVFDIAKNDAELSGMGTTVVAAIVTENYAVISHVGDSRAYLVNDNIVQLTSDHSVLQSLIESGKLSLAEAKSFPEKNVITRAIGVENEVFPDCSIVPVTENDSILLCTDGLTNFVEISEILNAFSNNDIADVADILIDKANS